ncbi:MAG: FAD-dependent monooxygenase [Hyphomonadaceae bacterium]|nr:FAD-dependent monooxygenase [Hyphomonadaceae bacterium]
MTRSVGIAGCGVAGLALATLVRAQGWRVVIFDKLEKPAPIGSGLILQPVGLHVLDALGVGDGVRALGARIERLFGLSGTRVVLDVRYDALGARAPRGFAVHRGALFEVLYDRAVAAGVEIVSRREVVAACAGRFVFADGAESARFDLIVDALGMRSPLSTQPRLNLPYGALWASLDWVSGFDPAALEQRYQAARKMAGVLPIGRLSDGGGDKAAFFWSLRHDAREAWRGASIDAWKDEARALWPATAPLLDQIASHDDLVFAAYAHRTLASPLSRDVVHVGDSWHCTSPQLGQGANMALLDAYALALSLDRQGDLTTALAEYERLRLWHIRLYQSASWLFTPAYQSDSGAIAWLRDRLAAPVSRLWPAPQTLAALVAGQWGWPLGAMGDGRAGENTADS